MTPRRTLILWCLALVAVHAVMSAWQPLQNDDWTHLMWDREHDGGWLVTHLTANTLVPYVFAHARGVFAAVNALAALALVLGVFVIAHRRLPRDTWRDTLGVIAGSAMIWAAQPRAGFVWFHRSHAATQIVGAAVAVWLLAPFVAGWRPRGFAVILIGLAGLVVGTSNHQLAIGTTVAVAILIRRTPADARPRWMWVALAALIAGTALGFAMPPYPAVRVFGRGFEGTLLTIGQSVRATGKLVTGVLLLALARLAVPMWRPAAEPAVHAELPAPRTTRAWIIAWLALTGLALASPHYSEAATFPATIALVIGLAPYVAWLCELRAVGGAVTALVVIVQVGCWARGLTTYAPLYREFEDRMARIHAAPPGGVATILPYLQSFPDDWCFGEDWLFSTRQVPAIELFGLRDIAFDDRFLRFETNPGVALRFEITGLTDAQRAAFVPAIWASDPQSAKVQFETLTRRLRHAGIMNYTARLVVDDLAFAERGARPYLLAWFEHGQQSFARANHSAVDDNNVVRVRVQDTIPARFPEAHLVTGGHASPIRYRNGGYELHPRDTERYAVVVCNAERCLLVDAFIPRL